MAQEQVPAIPKALLDWLERTAPMPVYSDDLHTIYAKLGARDIVANLRTHFNRQNGITKE